MKLVFKTNINCGNCIKKVSPFLNEIEGISWEVDIVTVDKLLFVEGEYPDSNQIIEAVEEAGFEIELLEEN
jgi:copper chaperone